SYADHALRAMRLLIPTAVRSPTGFGHLLGAVDFYTDRVAEIVIVGRDAHATMPLVDVVRARWLPNKVLIVAHDPGDDAVKKLPLLQGRAAAGTKAYVCHNGTCELPVATSEDLTAQLDAG
ncbi:MAG: thioredoxin domain-containing protein, partial [Actinomycetota bacterium]